MQIFLVFIFALLTAAVSAEGIPVLDGKVVDDHTVIDLTESQAEEIEVLETLTLTSDQWARLRKIGSECPKRFPSVFPIYHHDCTCADPEYAILIDRRKAAILHSQIQADDDRDLKSVFTTASPSVLGSRWDPVHKETLRLNLKAKGQAFLGGVSIPLEKVQKYLSYPQMDAVTGTNPVPNKRTIVFQIAPGAEADESLKQRCMDIKKTATASGWKVYFYPPKLWGLD